MRKANSVFLFHGKREKLESEWSFLLISLEDLFRKRNEIIKACRNEFLYTKRSFDERKSLFQIYDDLEKKYEQFNERLKIIESEVDVQRYIQLFNYFTNLKVIKEVWFSEPINLMNNHAWTYHQMFYLEH